MKNKKNNIVVVWIVLVAIFAVILLAKQIPFWGSAIKYSMLNSQRTYLLESISKMQYAGKAYDEEKQVEKAQVQEITEQIINDKTIRDFELDAYNIKNEAYLYISLDILLGLTLYVIKILMRKINFRRRKRNQQRQNRNKNKKGKK